MEYEQNAEARYEKSRAQLQDSLTKLGGLENISMSTVGMIRNRAIEANLAGDEYKLKENLQEFSGIPSSELNKYFMKQKINLKSAFSWGKENLKEKLTENYLSELNNKVSPEARDLGYGYRDGLMEVGGSSFVFPFPEEVPSKMNDYIARISNKINSKNSLDVVDVSILAHIDLVTIHPFYDGNGKTARFVQNFILEKAGIPSLKIGYDECLKYENLVGNAQFEAGSSSDYSGPKGKELYSYMMDKINDSVQEVIQASN